MKQLQVRPVGAYVQEFAQRFHQFHDAAIAQGACKFVSYELAKYLKQNGTAAELIHLQGCLADYPNPNVIWKKKPRDEWSHYVVLSGGRTYDLTARQFDTTLPYPFVCAPDELRSNWLTVEPDDFINSLVDEFYPGT